MSQFEQIAVVCNLTKVHLPVSKSLLTQGLFGWALYGERCVFF